MFFSTGPQVDIFIVGTRYRNVMGGETPGQYRDRRKAEKALFDQHGFKSEYHFSYRSGDEKAKRLAKAKAEAQAKVMRKATGLAILVREGSYL